MWLMMCSRLLWGSEWFLLFGILGSCYGVLGRYAVDGEFWVISSL